MSYRKFHLFLDLFGILGIGLAISYYLVGHQVPEQNKDQELFNLWGNFSTEIVGIWLGVRLIDYVIQQNEKKHSLRIRIVRNMRFLVGVTRSSIDFPNRPVIAKLKYEIDWSNKIFSGRQKYLSKDEINDVENFYLALSNLSPKIEKLFDLQEKSCIDEETRKDLDEERKDLWSILDRVEEIRQKAEINILEETEEE
jgi:hypothetical protein